VVEALERGLRVVDDDVTLDDSDSASDGPSADANADEKPGEVES